MGRHRVTEKAEQVPRHPHLAEEVNPKGSNMYSFTTSKEEYHR